MIDLFLDYLKFARDLTGNYGWGPFALGLGVPVVFLPLYARAMRDALKLSGIQSELAGMSAQSRMEVLKQHGINPFFGCFVWLVVAPVVFALWYGFIRSFEEMSRAGVVAPFFWIPDMTLPYGWPPLSPWYAYTLLPLLVVTTHWIGFRLRARALPVNFAGAGFAAMMGALVLGAGALLLPSGATLFLLGIGLGGIFLPLLTAPRQARPQARDEEALRQMAEAVRFLRQKEVVEEREKLEARKRVEEAEARRRADIRERLKRSTPREEEAEDVPATRPYDAPVHGEPQQPRALGKNAIAALVIAEEEAKRRESSEVLPEHMLLGLTAVERCTAVQVLGKLQINLPHLRAAMERALHSSAHGRRSDKAKFGARAQEVLRLAAAEARKRGKKEVGTEGLLLGVIAEGGTAGRTLERNDCTLAAARNALDAEAAAIPVPETVPAARPKTASPGSSVGFTGHAGPVRALAALREDSLLSAGDDGILRCWNVGTGRLSWEINAHYQAITALALSDDSGTAVSADADGHLRIWDAAAAEPLKVVRLGRGINALALPAPGSLAVVGVEDGEQLTLVDLRSGKSLRTWGGYTSPATCVAFSSDERSIVSGHGNGDLHVWDVESDDEVRSFSAHVGAINGVAFDLEGRIILSAGNDGRAKAWDLLTEECVREYTDNRGAITALAVSPWGPSVACGNEKGQVYEWNAASGKRSRSSYPEHRGAVLALCFSQVGDFLFSGGADAAINYSLSETTRRAMDT